MAYDPGRQQGSNVQELQVPSSSRSESSSTATARRDTRRTTLSQPPNSFITRRISNASPGPSRVTSRSNSIVGGGVKPLETSPLSVSRQLSRSPSNSLSWVHASRPVSQPFPSIVDQPAATRIPAENYQGSVRRRSYRVTNPDEEEDEFMAIDANIPTDPKTNKPKGKFIGGFMAGIKRFPKNFTVKKREKHPGMYQANQSPSLPPPPVYASNPSTPVVDPTVYQANQSSFSQIPPALVPGGGADYSQPVILLDPSASQVQDHGPVNPADVSRILSSPAISQAYLAGEARTSTPRPSEHSLPYVEPPDLPLPSSISPYPTSHRELERQPEDVVPPQASPHAASIAVHPAPAEDYLQMSKPFSAPVSTLSTTEPSFTTELNNVQGFFSRLAAMPWIASERITEDYRPGLSRGAWAWKAVRKPGTGGRHAGDRGSMEIVLRPVAKPVSSWYTGIQPAATSRGAKREGKALPSHLQRRNLVDLLSSGTPSIAPSSIASPNAALSSPSMSPRSTMIRQRQRTSLYLPAGSTHAMPRRSHRSPRTPLSPSSGSTATPRARRPNRTHASTSKGRHDRGSSHREHGQEARHHRVRRSDRSVARNPEVEHSMAPTMVPLPMQSPQFSGGFVPGGLHYSPPQFPVYVINTPPAPPASEPDKGSPAASTSSPGLHTPSSGYTGYPMLSPVYMQMLPPTAVPNGSPPGVAGRGAPFQGQGFMPGAYQSTPAG